MRNSVVVCPGIYLYHDQEMLASTMKDFKEMYGPYAYGKIVSVPNRKTNVFEYGIEYDRKKSATVGEVGYEDLCTTVYGNAATKQLLKRGVERANLLDYRFSLKQNSAPKRKRLVPSTTNASINTPTESATTTATEGSVFLPGILNETDEVNDDGMRHLMKGEYQ